GLAEVRIERDRHDRLARLAPQRLPRIEKIAFDQLLCQGAAALLDLACTHVDPQRARNRGGIDTVMSIELAVLDGLERLRQQRWNLLRRDDDAILAVDREDAADQQRLEAHDGKLPAIAAAQALDGVGARGERQDGSRACLIREARRAQGYIDAAALQPVGAGALEPIDAPVLQALQL